MLKVEQVRKAFDQTTVLDGVSFELQSRTIVGLIGPSGGGKSTLLKILGRVAEADSGRVELTDGGSGISLMFQEGALFDSLNVFDNVAFPLVDGRVPTFTLPLARRSSVRASVEEILSRVGLLAACEKMPAQLSGGMRRRVSLARALVSQPSLLLLDDPTSGLDPVASSVIMNLVVELQRERGPATIVVSHDLRRLLPVVDRTLALVDGRIVYDGPVAGLRSAAAPELLNFVSCRYDFDPSESDRGDFEQHGFEQEVP